MNFKKRVNGSWTDTPHYIHNTSTDTLTLPAVLYPNDTTATVGLKGQMEQSGTPTPTTPIQPSECGERTGNLYFKKIASGSIDAGGSIVGNASYDCYVAKVEANQQYIGSGYVYAFYTNEPALGSTSYNGQRVVEQASNGFTSPIDGYVAVRHNTGVTDAMLNTGSTALPYEPFGVKIPILNNSQTTNVYLGEVESTRKIRELVLTGDDGGTWTYNGVFTNGNAYYNATIFTGYSPNKTGICSHLDAVTDTTATEGVYWGANANFITKIADGIDTPEKWRNYLAAQYAAGTPVCVWYVLATPQTAVVNEPLRKIGDYADTVSGITIPTIAGANTLSIGTTLQPSEVNVTYHGWHPVADVHEAVQSNNLFNPEHHITIENLDYIGDVYPANKYRINNVSNSPCYYKIGESGTTGTVNPTTNVYLNASDVVYIWCSVSSNRKIGVTEGSTVEEYEPYGIIWNP